MILFVAGPIPVQVTAGIALCMGLSAGLQTLTYKDYKFESGTKQWRDQAPRKPNPLRDPEGKMN